MQVKLRSVTVEAVRVSEVIEAVNAGAWDRLPEWTKDAIRAGELYRGGDRPEPYDPDKCRCITVCKRDEPNHYLRLAVGQYNDLIVCGLTGELSIVDRAAFRWMFEPVEG